MTEKAFTTLLRNFGPWHEHNSAPGTREANLCAILQAAHRSAGSFRMIVQIDADTPGADGLVTDFVSAVTAGTGADPTLNARRTVPWLHPVTCLPGAGEAGDMITRRYKIKAAYLRRSLTAPQLTTVYRHLTNSTGASAGGLELFGYGGQVNIDLADPAWNTSGVPWRTLYYKDNYPRLQRVKARWDPLNVFHHPLAVQPPAP